MAAETPRDFVFGYDVRPISELTPTEVVNANFQLQSGIRLKSLVKEADGDELQTHAAIYSTAAKTVGEFAKPLVNEQYLTPQGKIFLLRIAGQRALNAIEPLEDNATKLREEVAATDESFVAAGRNLRPGDVTEADWARRVDEARFQLRGLDPLELRSAYASARAQGDPAVVAAFESLGPVLTSVLDSNTGTESKQFIPALDPDDIRERQYARGRAQHPEAAQLRDRNERLASTYHDAVMLVRHDVLERVPDLDDLEAVTL